MESLIFEAVHKWMREQREYIKEDMANGVARDYSQYLAMSARYRMIEDFEEMIKTLEKRVEEL